MSKLPIDKAIDEIKYQRLLTAIVTQIQIQAEEQNVSPEDILMDIETVLMANDNQDPVVNFRPTIIR